MFLTTESSLAGKNYRPLKVIYANACASGGSFATENAYTKLWDRAVENALGKLYNDAAKLHADGVIGVSLSTTTTPEGVACVTAVATAIQFF
jgi:uncharacterized protein YbjQ (UPF0145 family)